MNSPKQRFSTNIEMTTLGPSLQKRSPAFVAARGTARRYKFSRVGEKTVMVLSRLLVVSMCVM